MVKITDFSIKDVLAQNEELRCKLESRDHQIKLLEEKINYLLYHRFNSRSERFGVPFTSTTLADWTIKGVERIISPLVVAMENALYEHDYLHIDETTLQVLSEEGRTAKQKSYIWW